MADVYLAEDEELGRKVALKMLNERHARDEQFVERFKREARNAAGLSHPHIVRIYDRGQAEDTYYIAMEYLDGPTLKELLVRKGPTPPLTAIKFAREILSALAEAHRNDIVHRDIKPHNVIVGPDWHIKVTDFGIARSGASQMTEAGSIVGTAQYLSPEQARGAPVDQRSDLYSLGIVLYELLTGKVPFTGDAAVEIAMKHLSEIPEPPSKLRPEISHDLDAVVMRALAKDPDQRYASAEEMDADLARVARGAAVSQQTEEAMTQVLAGSGIAAAPTIVSRPAVGTSPPAPPAVPSARLLRRRCRAAARSGRFCSACSPRDRRRRRLPDLPQGPVADRHEPDDRRAGRQERRQEQRRDPVSRSRACACGSTTTPSDTVAAGLGDRPEPRPGRPGAEGHDRHDHRLDRQAEGRRSRR